MPPPPKPKPPHKLELTTNSLRNTAFAANDDSMHYEVVTRFWHPHLTKINRADFENLKVSTVAEIERIPGREARVRFGEKGEWLPASQFLQFDEDRAWVPHSADHWWCLFTFTVVASSSVERTYNIAGRRIMGDCRLVGTRNVWFQAFDQAPTQLVKADDDQKTPVADFHPHKRHFLVFRMSRHAYIEVKPMPEVTDSLEKLIGES